MKITKIEAQVKRRGRYSIFVDDQFAFGLSETGLIESGISIGLEIDEKRLAELKDRSDFDKIYGRVLDLLARRSRSEWEISDYLKRKQVDEETASEILNKLSSRGYVNDEKFARSWVESRRLLKATSKRKLSLELRQKRISDQIITQVIQEDETDEQDVLKKLIEKKRSQTRYQDDMKLIAYLARQGFSYGDIKETLSSLGEE